MSEPKTCKECGRVWRTYTYTPCDLDDCWECDLFGIMLDRPKQHAEAHDDVDEVVSYQCPHGVEYDCLCRGCGARVYRWGVGGAGFGELCDCSKEQS